MQIRAHTPCTVSNRVTASDLINYVPTCAEE